MGVLNSLQQKRLKYIRTKVIKKLIKRLNIIICYNHHHQKNPVDVMSTYPAIHMGDPIHFHANKGVEKNGWENDICMINMWSRKIKPT